MRHLNLPKNSVNFSVTMREAVDYQNLKKRHSSLFVVKRKGLGWWAAKKMLNSPIIAFPLVKVVCLSLEMVIL